MKIWHRLFSTLVAILMVLVVIVGWYDWPWIAQNIGVITFALAIGYGASKFTS
ncbi:hypothetical protein PP187_gp284 [Klebsiella phage vB_KvM-Eowyn]|uniref:Uncharacterized protein n=1 Tax=Klebsiella phage vB_KvM-Eowyn TaxID=2762819 RepID=A0A7R8MKF3_9CAUD|nr:hypothetical protein PP187_gp284 [Klebsiella phage vB_KvM-Eowyn]CAD5236273.1 hypothetical protein LLCLJKAH_00284 [Klebsiella phage vB_KvM-Eowyn]